VTQTLISVICEQVEKLLSSGNPMVTKIFQDTLRPQASAQALDQGSRVAMSLLSYGILRDLQTAEMCLQIICEYQG
jgi:hypothetical protein